MEVALRQLRLELRPTGHEALLDRVVDFVGVLAHVLAEVPLKGILVLTSDTKTPTRSFLTSILSRPTAPRFFATMVATSAPPSKSSGMRFANR